MMAKRSLRRQAKDREEDSGERIICRTSGMRCIHCPMCVTGVCPHLKRYLKTGTWDEGETCPSGTKGRATRKKKRPRQ